MRRAIVRIGESRVKFELIDLVKFRPEALGWHFRYPQLRPGFAILLAPRIMRPTRLLLRAAIEAGHAPYPGSSDAARHRAWRQDDQDQRPCQTVIEGFK